MKDVIPSNPTRRTIRRYDKGLYRQRYLVEICQSRCCPPDVQIYVAPRLRGFLFASGTRDRQGRLSAPAQLRCVP
jgi:hypothetical protein